MIKQLSTFSGLCFILFCLSGCIDEIELDIPSGLEEGIVIQAKLVKGDPHQLEVRLNLLYNFEVSTIGIINADEIYLVHENGNQIAIPKAADGFYKTKIPSDDPDFNIDYDTSCYLDIRFSNGQQIRSTPEILVQVPVPERIGYELGLDYVYNPTNPNEPVLDTFVQFSLNMPLVATPSSENSFLRLDMERTYKLTERIWPAFSPEVRDICYITNNVSVLQPKVIDGKNYPSENLQDYFIFQEPINNYYFIEGYTLSVYVESLTSGAFTHFDQVQKSVIRTGSMLESPAGVIRSNFYDPEDENAKVYGYFYMTERDTIRQYVPPSLLNYPDTFCLDPFFEICTGLPFNPCYPNICEDCLGENGSTLERPTWWNQ